MQMFFQDKTPPKPTTLTTKLKKSEAVADVVGYNKDFVWLRVPLVWPHKILTLDREWLAHGYAQYPRLVVRCAPESLTHDGWGYVADIEIIEGLDDQDEPVDPRGGERT